MFDAPDSLKIPPEFCEDSIFAGYWTCPKRLEENLASLVWEGILNKEP